MDELAPWISAAAILISATIGAVMARNAINTNRITARRRATLDIILKTEDEKHHQGIKATFLEVRDGPGLMSTMDAKTRPAKDERQAVQAFLNHYELLCIGMMQDILDEYFYYKWKRGQFLRHWNDSKELIEELQKENKKLFVNFQLFAERWEKGCFVTDHYKDYEKRSSNGKNFKIPGFTKN